MPDNLDNPALNRRRFVQMTALSAALLHGQSGRASEPKRVAVIGGGIIGASIAYHLSRKGAQVTLLERSDLATQASRGTLAWINASWAKQPRHYHAFTQRGVAGWRTLQTELNLPVRWGGSLEWFASEDRQKKLVAQIKEQQRWGEPAEMITTEQCRTLEPNFQFIGTTEAAFSPNDGAVDPVLATKMLTLGAEAMGATIKTFCNVESARPTAGGAAVLETNCGALEVDRYVLATGADPTAIKTLAGLDIPQRSTPGIIMITQPMPRLINRLIAAPGANLHQRDDGRIVLAGQQGVPSGEAHMERLKDRPNRFPLETFATQHGERILAAAEEYLPGISRAEIEDVYIGWRPMPLDGHPVLGTSAANSAAYIAIMHSGVSLAPVVGELVAQEIMYDHADEALALYRPDRNFETVKRY
jgi:glycine/D-amino acid oxidase-like deaminating enzyme